MTTYTVSIDEKSKEGKAIIAKLKSLSSVKRVWQKSPRLKKSQPEKATSISAQSEEKALAVLMKAEETGKLVSKAKILKALKAVK